MGLSSKQVSGDGIDWGRTLLQSGSAEQPKPPSIRRQPPLHQQSEPLKCPRCASTNTKFCYYNNYNKSQPRHFCKSCKRHWTKGGTLRNVPVGGGRKNKRPKISKPATTTSAAASAAPRRQELPEFGGQKNMSNIFYQALMRSSSPLLHETTKVTNLAFPEKNFMTNNDVDTGGHQNPTTEFQFSNLNTFDMNASLNYQSLDAFDHYAVNLDSVEESTITSVNIPSSSSVPWPGPDSSSNLDLPNYWNWNDIDVLNSADLNISWDDDDDNAAVKP